MNGNGFSSTQSRCGPELRHPSQGKGLGVIALKTGGCSGTEKRTVHGFGIGSCAKMVVAHDTIQTFKSPKKT
ncbi:MAG: hypothetical protein SWQ30_17650 [Thermodesulfobacteriota bacterium]|nr:hypothetical protein [Thermodesulfobacteriota bacterium]